MPELEVRVIVLLLPTCQAFGESMRGFSTNGIALESMLGFWQYGRDGKAFMSLLGGVSMSDVKWFMQGKFLMNCSCNYGCPCDFMVDPTYGHCDGIMGMKIDEGYYGDVRLDDVIIAATFYFPRAVHHGGGHMQPILPESTTEAQREAVFKIMSGEGQPVGSMFQIFSVTVEHVHEPLFLPIEFEWDIKERKGRLAIPNVATMSAEPIRNPVTDEPHQIRTVLPQAWMFYESEVASGTAKGIGDIKFDFAQRHCDLAHFAYDNSGMAYSYDEAKQRYGLDN